MLKVNNKDVRMTSHLTPFSNNSIVYFAQVNVCWDDRQKSFQSHSKIIRVMGEIRSRLVRKLQ